MLVHVLRNGSVGRSCRRLADLVARQATLHAILILLLGVATPTLSATLAVPTDYATITEALTAAVPGDTVLVSPGVYAESMKPTPHGLSMILMASDVVLLSTDGPDVTFLDGMGGGRCVYFGEVGMSTRLEGFTIRNGVALGTELYEDHGGGVFCFHSSPTLSGCIFTENAAGIGGGMACDHPSTPTVRGCTFERNEALDGGGFAFLGSSAARLESCVFRENEAVRGGAVECYVSTPTIEACVFEENHASSVGGAVHVFLGGPRILESTFWMDDAATGGTIRAETGSLVEVLNSSIAGSEVTGSISSGAISLLDSFASIDHSIVAFTTMGSAVQCEGASSGADVYCSDFFGNEGGDWIDCVAGAFGDGNIADDPLFCAFDSGVLTLDVTSPCTGPNAGDCGQIGALPAGCEVSGLPSGELPGGNGDSNEGGDGGAKGWAGLSIRLEENPVRGRLQVELVLTAPAELRIEVIDVSGRCLSTVAARPFPSGRSSIGWDVRYNEHSSLPRGTYFLRAVSPFGVTVRPFVVVG
ncbi:MAG: right-handed parallel beta-helix repeat-containing protein [Candidatus Eisenbacteria bacterium]